MRVRALSPDGDYRFGRGRSDFLADSPDAVAQSVKTRLQLYRGEWFLDTVEGTPWYESVLGTGTADTFGPVLRARVLETPGVKEILSFEAAVDREARAVTITCEVDTIYGVVTISAPVQVGPAT